MLVAGSRSVQASNLTVDAEGRYSCVGVTRLDTVSSRAAWVTLDGEDRE